MLTTIAQSPFVQKFQQIIQEENSILFEELWDTPKALLLHYLEKTLDRPIVVITSGKREAKLYEDMRFFSEHVVEFPSWEALPGEEIQPSADIIGKRFDVLYDLAISKTSKVVFTPLQAILQKLPNKDQLLMAYHTFRVGEEYSFEQLPHLLAKCGYERVSLVNDKGQFAVRGGLIDIFPMNSPHPYRLDFFGDELEHIKIFDPIGQTTMDQTSSIHLSPANEMTLLEKQCSSLFAYFRKKPILIFDDLLEIEDHLVALSQMPHFNSKWMMTFSEMLTLSDFHIFWSNSPIEQLSETKQSTKPGRDFFTGKQPLEPVEFEMFSLSFSTKRMHHPFETIGDHFSISTTSVEHQKQQIAQHLHKLSSSSRSVFLTCEGLEQKNKMHAWLPKLPPNTQFEEGYLSSGFAMRDYSILVISYTDLTQHHKLSRKKWRSAYHTPPSEFHQLQAGDYVVHFHNGIGKYLGVEKQKNHLGIESEFLIIEYAEGSKLFVPASQAHLVSKYIGSHQEKPELHKIGTSKWNKAKQQTTKSIIGYAKDLLQIQAQRESSGGFVYQDDSHDMVQFEDEFPYVETDDQLIAIDSIKKDMCSTKAMDRLVCGDVGYGKTEVAMRAAFKAVADGGKQVGVLVPTTVLAMQHYDNFRSRMENTAVQIGIVSRFQKPKEIKKTLEQVENGEIDILIGTHRILGKDIIFKNLGMIIIDEEQRFGVRAKEKLKALKSNIDCITLTATPIPRTLYMSLINIRDMSVINSPPQDRLPIKTIICERELELIKTAILRELTRDGQAYFIHNRVETIFEVAEELQTLVPQAKIAVAHGQMPSDRIDQIFHDFKTGTIDVLVATSLVENGIDIPNANTILIDRAHQFGVADLYQLRGRVGRWNKAAYAYFLTPKNRALPEISQKRLQALVEASGFGGGMKLAMRDLEIRGAGDILGVKQSGHVSTVGFHLYCKLLKKAVHALKNNKPATFNEAKLEFTFDAKIPDYYIDDSSIRLEFYHRFGEANNNEEVDSIYLELIDRFGKAPEPVIWLYHMSKVRVFATNNQITSIKYDKNSLIVEKQTNKGVLKKNFLIPPGLLPNEVELITIKRIEEGF